MSSTSYTDNNVVYTYTVPVSGNTGTAFVDVSPDAVGVINILSTFVIDSVTYTVTSIGEGAFDGVVLTNVNISNTIITIGKNAFKNTGLSSINIPDSVTIIDDYAFSDNKIETTNIGNNVTTIGINAFFANKLTTITIPSKVVTIGSSAFQNNALNNVTIIGTEVTTIGASAFQGNNLSELFIPVSVTSLGNSAFRSNKLEKVYFFNIPTMGFNVFANNNISMIAYYINTSTTAKINSLPAVFTTKTSMTKVEILKYQIQQGVTVQYLLDDNFTLAEMINADGSADWLRTYYSLQQLVDANFPVSKLLLATNVTPLDLFNCGVSIVNLKAASADTKVMLNQFSLADLITANYTVYELKTASESIIAPVVTADKKVTVAKFKQANANVSQILGSYSLSLLIAADYRVSVLLAADSTISLTSFVTASAPLWDLMNNYSLVSLISYPFSVSQLITASNEKDSNNNYRVTDTAKQSLDTKVGTLKDAGALIGEMVNSFSLTALVATGYTVSELKTAKPSATIADFKEANANVSQMLGSYSLSLLIAADYRVSVLLAADSTISLTSFVTASAPLWDLMNNYSLVSLISYPFSVSQLITASNEKDSDIYKVTNVAKQALDTKAGTLKSAGALISEMVNAFSLTALVSAGYTVSELKTAKPSATIADFKEANANVSQMLGSYSLSLLIAADYSVSVLLAADSTISLTSFVTASAPLWDLLNNYTLSELVSYPFSVNDLITASNDYRVTNVAYQALDRKPGTLKAVNAPIEQMLACYWLMDLYTGGYSVYTLKEANPNLTLYEFVVNHVPLWDLMNNYTLSELVSYPFSVADLISASNLKDAGINKVTDIAKQALDTKAGTFKALNAPIGQMIDAFSLIDLLATGYTVKDLKDGSVNSNKVFTISSFKTASANLAQMINVYSLFDLIHVEPQGYSVDALINASKEKDSNNNYVVIDPAYQDLDTKAGTLKDAGALITQMVSKFSLQTLLSSPVSYTVAELKVVNGVTLSNLNSAFVNMGFTIKARLDNLYNEFSLKELNTHYIVSELANYTKADSNIVDLTVADFKAITEPSVSPAQMVAYFTISELYNEGYTVQYIVTNGNSNMTVQDIIYDGSVPLWDILNYVGPKLGYYRKVSSDLGLLPITDLMNAVSNTNSNYKHLKVYDFYIGTNPSHSKPDDVPDYANNSNEVSIRNTDIAEVATLFEMLRIKYFSIDSIIYFGTSSINNNALKNLTVADFNAAAKLDRVWMYENRLSDFILYFNLSDLLNDWSVYELKTKGSAENLPLYSGKTVNVLALKEVNAPAWDMLNNFSLSELIVIESYRARYTSSVLVNASKEKVNGVYKVTVVDNRNITVTQLKTAGAFLYDLMGYFELTDLISEGYSVSELITESNSKYIFNGIYTYFVTRTDHQQLGGTLIQNGGSLTQEQLNTCATKLKAAGAPISQMIGSFSLTTMVAVGYGVTELKIANSSFTAQDFAQALVPLSEMLNHYKFYNLYDYYTISELRVASESSHVTDTDNKNLTLAKFKANNAPIWKMLNAYQLSELTPFYTAGELVDNSKTYLFNVNEPNANLTLDDIYRVEDLWDIMNIPASPGDPSPRHGINELLDTGYTVKELRDTIALKDENDNYRVTLPYYRNDFNVREIWKVTQYRNRSIYLSYLAQTINAFDLSYIIRVNFDYMEWGVNLKLYEIYPFADILDAQTQYGSTIIDTDKQVTALKLANAIKSYEVEARPYFISRMSDAYGGANITTLQVMLQDAQFKPIEILSNGNATYYNNMVDVNGKSTKVINFRATAVGTNITSSDMYEAFTVYELLSAYTITEINNIRVNLATPLPILTVYEILNLMGDISDINYPQPYYEKIRDDLVNLVKNGTFSYSLSDVYANNYTNGSARYIGVDNFKNTFTIGQLKDAGANFRNMVDVYYLTEATNNFYQNPPVETSPAGLTELLTVYSVSEIGPIDTFFDWNSSDRYALIGFPIRLFKSAGADIKQMLNYFNTLNIYGQSSDINLQNNTNGLYWLLFFGYTVSELKAASESTTGTIVANDKKVTIAQFKQVDADIKQMLTAYNTNAAGLKALLVEYTVLQLKTASESTITPVVPADKKISIKKFYDAEADVVQMLNVYNTGSVGLKALLVEYTVLQLHSASNSPSIANFKAADADYAQMLTAYNTGSVGLAALLVEYTVLQLHSASNSPSIANFEAADASIPQMLIAYNIDTDGLKDLLVTYTVSRLKTASVDVSVPVDKKVTIAKFKLANADVWQMLNNYILSDLVISGSFAAGYTTAVLVTASSDSRVTVIGNKNISLTTIISAGAPLYDLMNYYTLSQLVAVPYSVSQLITASKLKDSNNDYSVTVTTYQNLDSDAGAVTLKAALALIGQMVVAFSLTQLIAADYRVSPLKIANSAYTISNFKTAVAPLWDMLNNYDIEDLLNNGYTVAELKLASEDIRTTRNRNLNGQKFTEIVIRNSHLTLDYVGVAADILNNFTLYEVTNPGWRVDELIRYSRDSRVTVVDNQNLVLNDFKTRSYKPTWDILLNYSLAEMVTGGYTVAELKTTIPYNSSASIPLNKRVTIASLKTAGSELSDIINNYTVRELADESSTIGSYTLTQLVNTSQSTTVVPLVTDSNKVTLERLVALSPLPPLTYLLTHYTTLQLVGGGISPISLANVNPTILEEVVALGFVVKITTPRLLSSSVTSGVVAINLNQAAGSDVSIDKYFVSYSSDNGKTFTPFAKLMDTIRTPNVPQLGSTLYVSGLQTNKFYSFRIMASYGSVDSYISNTLKNVFVG